jgi:hypothetical protein
LRKWTNDELDGIDTFDEIRIAPRQSDGTLRRSVIVWVVRVGDSLYVRSVLGRDAAWYRGTLIRHEARIEAGGVERDVRLVETSDGLDDEIDAAYREKYDGEPVIDVDNIVHSRAQAATLRLDPVDA